MKQLSYKYKIIIMVVGFVIFAVLMFWYGYNILDSKNAVLSAAAIERQTEFELLQVEQKSFEQGQKDLASLSEKAVPPSELFSKDTKVVKEIKKLEEIAAQNGLVLSLAITGSTLTAEPAEGTLSEILIVPYVATLEGSFEGIMKFMESTEHLAFATQTSMVDISAQPKGPLRANLNSQFYIKK